MNLQPADNAHHYYINSLILAFAILMACSPAGNQAVAPPVPQAPSKPIMSVVVDTVKGSISGAWQAVQTPLEDIGLKRQPIPVPLEQIAMDPYAMPSPVNCPVITSEILTLDNLLGPDIAPLTAEEETPSLRNISTAAMPSWQNRDQYIAQGSSLAQEKATDMVRNQVSILPYRGWIRQLSGANAHAKRVSYAYEAGKLRRAFLKGLSHSMHCWYIGG